MIIFLFFDSFFVGMNSPGLKILSFNDWKLLREEGLYTFLFFCELSKDSSIIFSFFAFIGDAALLAGRTFIDAVVIRFLALNGS